MTFFIGIIIAYVAVAFMFCLDATSSSTDTSKMLGPLLIDSGSGDIDALEDDYAEVTEVDAKLDSAPITLIEPTLEALPTDPLAIAILKSTLTPEQVAQIRVVRQPGALPGEILDELPVGQFDLEFERSMSLLDDSVDVTLHD